MGDLTLQDACLVRRSPQQAPPYCSSTDQGLRAARGQWSQHRHFTITSSGRYLPGLRDPTPAASMRQCQHQVGQISRCCSTASALLQPDSSPGRSAVAAATCVSNSPRPGGEIARASPALADRRRPPAAAAAPLHSGSLKRPQQRCCLARTFRRQSRDPTRQYASPSRPADGVIRHDTWNIQLPRSGPWACRVHPTRQGPCQAIWPHLKGARTVILVPAPLGARVWHLPRYDVVPGSAAQAACQRQALLCSKGRDDQRFFCSISRRQALTPRP